MVGATGRRAVTMRDVAARASVDISTVSKVLKGNGISVRSETRTRIMDAITALNYRPNPHARGLRLQRTGAMGMLLPDITNPVYANIVRGAVKRADEIGYSVLLAEATAAEAKDAYRILVQDKRIDGLLVATARRTGQVSVQLARDGVPHVFVNRRVEGFAPSVTVDDAAGAALAARAMIKYGHTRLGIVAGPRDVDTACRRLEGFRAEVAAHGLSAPVMRRGAFTPGGGHAAMVALLATRKRPTAVLVSNFTGAVGALRAVYDAGLTVPGDVSLVSFDDAEIASFLRPALTAIQMPFEEMGSIAVDVLAAVIDGASSPGAVASTKPQLVIRESLARLS